MTVATSAAFRRKKIRPQTMISGRSAPVNEFSGSRGTSVRRVIARPATVSGERVLADVEERAGERLAAGQVADQAAEGERRNGGTGPEGDHRREGEGGRGEQLALLAAQDHVDRQQLGDDHAAQQHPQQQRRLADQIDGLRRHRPAEAGEARRDHEGDVELEGGEELLHAKGVLQGKRRYVERKGRRPEPRPGTPSVAASRPAATTSAGRRVHSPRGRASTRPARAGRPWPSPRPCGYGSCSPLDRSSEGLDDSCQHRSGQSGAEQSSLHTGTSRIASKTASSIRQPVPRVSAVIVRDLSISGSDIRPAASRVA